VNPTSRQSGGLPAGFTTLRPPRPERAGYEQAQGPSREGRPFPFEAADNGTFAPLTGPWDRRPQSAACRCSCSWRC
jgi:hypothetical protein